MVHYTNLVVHVLSKLNMVSRLENLLQTLEFVCLLLQKSQRHLEVSKLVEISETKGNKNLRNVKIRWIPMLALAKRVLAKFCIFGCQDGNQLHI
jgi:hypothetical protein